MGHRCSGDLLRDRTLDLDLLLRLDGLGLLRKGDFQHPIFEFRFDLVRVDAFRDSKVALEGSEVPFLRPTAGKFSLRLVQHWGQAHEH